MDIVTIYNDAGEEPWRVIDVKMDSQDYWDLRSLLAEVILAALVDFRAAKRHGYPACDEIPTMDAWNATLDKMIDAFRIIVLDAPGVRMKHHVRVSEGMALFGEYFEHLWD